jgi:hypothetical protein
LEPFRVEPVIADDQFLKLVTFICRDTWRGAAQQADDLRGGRADQDGRADAASWRPFPLSIRGPALPLLLEHGPRMIR